MWFDRLVPQMWKTQVSEGEHVQWTVGTRTRDVWASLTRGRDRPGLLKLPEAADLRSHSRVQRGSRRRRDSRTALPITKGGGTHSSYAIGW